MVYITVVLIRSIWSTVSTNEVKIAPEKSSQMIKLDFDPLMRFNDTRYHNHNAFQRRALLNGGGKCMFSKFSLFLSWKGYKGILNNARD